LDAYSGRILTGYFESLLREVSGLSPAGRDWGGLVNIDGMLN